MEIAFEILHSCTQLSHFVICDLIILKIVFGIGLTEISLFIDIKLHILTRYIVCFLASNFFLYLYRQGIATNMRFIFIPIWLVIVIASEIISKNTEKKLDYDHTI